MTDLTNKTLAVLIGLVLAVSLVGTWAVLNRMNVSIAGAFTTTGTGNVTANVGETVSISMVTQAINFSSVVSLSTYNSSDTPGNCNTSGGAEGIVPVGQCYFTIKNDGTVTVNITAKNSTSPALWTSGAYVASDYQLYAEDNSTNGAVDLTANESSPINVTHAGSKILGSLPITNGANTVNVRAKIYVPAQESYGVKTGTITFTASKA